MDNASIHKNKQFKNDIKKNNWNIIYNIPDGITIKVLNQKLLTIAILGNDFQQINQIAAEIRALKPVEPYKGKGILYNNEIVRRKVGKSGKK